MASLEGETASTFSGFPRRFLDAVHTKADFKFQSSCISHLGAGVLGSASVAS